MKIVDRRTFLDMPENTVFSKYEEHCFGPLAIKGEQYIDDFIYQEINDSIVCTSDQDQLDSVRKAAKNNASLEMDFECMTRDGCYDKDQLFAVWEYKDLHGLMMRLMECFEVLA